MIGGVSFQPGQSGAMGTQDKPKSSANTGVQEAIKVLSLRLPKVVGARAMAPQALLESPGSGGGRVDSVVSQVMGRMFPTGAPAPSAPMMPSAAPEASSPAITGSVTPNTPLASMVPQEAFAPSVARAPRISPINEPGVPGAPGEVPRTAPAPQQIDYMQPARPSDGTKTEVTMPSDGAGNPMDDFLEFLRRNALVQEPAPPQDTPSI